MFRIATCIKMSCTVLVLLAFESNSYSQPVQTCPIDAEVKNDECICPAPIDRNYTEKEKSILKNLSKYNKNISSCIDDSIQSANDSFAFSLIEENYTKETGKTLDHNLSEKAKRNQIIKELKDNIVLTFTIYPSGKNTMSIDLPGLNNIIYAKDIIYYVPKLFKDISFCPSPDQVNSEKYQFIFKNNKLQSPPPVATVKMKTCAFDTENGKKNFKIPADESCNDWRLCSVCGEGYMPRRISDRCIDFFCL